MTDEEFDEWFSEQTEKDLLQYCVDKTRGIDFGVRGSRSYSIVGRDPDDSDFIAAIKQDMYEMMTGRE